MLGQAIRLFEKQKTHRDWLMAKNDLGRIEAAENKIEKQKLLIKKVWLCGPICIAGASR
jgi:hypothetical protein